MNLDSQLILALPKGRILKEFLSLVEDTKFCPKVNPEKTRKILLETKTPHLKVLVIRGWDVATYVTSGTAHLGAVGKDILMEINTNQFIELTDLKIGKCRISLAGMQQNILKKAKLKIATKYPKIASEYLSSIGIKPEIVYLNGSQEIAPAMGLADAIIDLVDTGNTLKENNLIELRVIKDISTRLIVNKAALKTKGSLVEEFNAVVSKL